MMYSRTTLYDLLSYCSVVIIVRDELYVSIMNAYERFTFCDIQSDLYDQLSHCCLV
jgi:hypothetical protein